MDNINVTIGGKKFEIIEAIKNITIADSFVVPSNKVGDGNGEAKLYVGYNTSQITDFFGSRGFEIKSLLSRHNLKSYLDNAFREYNFPSANYRRKNDLPELWKSRYENLNTKDSVLPIKIKDQVQLLGQRVYVNSASEKSDQANYYLLRELPLPVISYLNIYKIKDSNNNIYYYFTIHLLGNESSICESDSNDPEIEKFIPGSDDINVVEQEVSNEGVNINVPFDPNKIRVRTTPSTIGQIIDDLEDKFIDLDTEFQRLPNLWDDTKKSRFIESILLKLPIPAFYFNEKEENDLEVIDGLQRISTIQSYVLFQNFRLSNLEFLKEYEGKLYSELPSTFQRRIKTFPITIYIIEKGTPDEVKYNIFKRVNTGGLELTEQEIRHAINQGLPAELIADLVRGEDDVNDQGEIRFRKDTYELRATREGKAFVQATSNRIGTFRMQDRDFATRFASFYLINYANYEPNLDTFLNKGMASIKDLDDFEVQELKNNFYSSMILAYAIFGDDAFRKRFFKNDGRKPINKALFEVLSVSFANLSQFERDKLEKNKLIFREKFISIHHDPQFLRAISQGTAIKENVFKRFKEIERIINETINYD